MEYNQNVMQTLRSGGYGDRTLFFNPYGFLKIVNHLINMYTILLLVKPIVLELMIYIRRSLTVGDKPTNVDVQPYVGGTMTTEWYSQ